MGQGPSITILHQAGPSLDYPIAALLLVGLIPGPQANLPQISNTNTPRAVLPRYPLNPFNHRVPAGAQRPPWQAQLTQPLGWYLEQGH